MKAKLSLLLLLLLSGNSFAQYYERSSSLPFTISGPARNIWATGLSVDYKGNAYRVITIDPCMGCYPEPAITKRNQLNNPTWGFAFPLSDPNGVNAKCFEDDHGNNYMIWQADGVLNYGGTYDVSGGYTHTLFKFGANNAVQWIIDFENATSIYTDTADNIYAINANKLLRRYDSAGAVTDSIQFTSTTMPSFMDSLGYFYRFSSGTLNKTDWGGNILWSRSLPVGGVNYNMKGPEIFAATTDSVYTIDLAGNITAYQNFAQTAALTFDLNGNYYAGPQKKYNRLTGMRYVNNAIPYSTLMDRTGRFYYAGYYTSTTGNDPVLFEPLRTYYSPRETWANDGYGNYFTYKNAWDNMLNTDESTPHITFTIANYASAYFCTNNEKEIDFNYDKYPAAILGSGFRAELSDSAGSFAAPVTIGSRLYSPIRITIPGNVFPGNNYRIRIVPNGSNITYSADTINNVRIRTSPTGKINYTNAIHYNYGPGYPTTVLQCDSSFFTAQANPLPVTYNWQLLHFNTQTGYFLPNQNLGTNDTLHQSIQPNEIVRLTITDSLGCSVKDSVDVESYFHPSGTPYTLYLPDTININSNPVVFTSSYYHYVDTAYGAGVYVVNDSVIYRKDYKYFDPALAGPGWHYVYANLKPSNYIGTITCNEDSLVDSVYVSSTPFARLATRSHFYKCPGDTVNLQLQFHGTPPFVFSIKTNISATPIGPFVTLSNTYTLTVSPAVYQQYSIGYFEDDNGIYTNAWNGTVSVKVRSFPNTINTAGSTTFCLGDSAKLDRNILYPTANYLWHKNNIPIPGATGTTYYAKTQGSYSVKFDTLGCSIPSNNIVITVPCVISKGPGGNSTLRGTQTETGNTTTTVFIIDAGDRIITRHNSIVKGFTLTDLLGRIIPVTTSVVSDAETVIYLPELARGIYLLSYMEDTALNTTKLVLGN